ncbi:hypothetical protein Leryth_020090 [Lithospermum erythrorhizon]|nr:hypothetical protein Leryth_020090 [Lithospermum erythrorhizon]
MVSNNELSFTSEANFCSRANLACANNVDGASSIRSTAKSFINQYGDDVAMLSKLVEGKTVHLPDLHEPFPSRSFLPSQIASKISLTSNQLKALFPESLEEMIEFSKKVLGAKRIISLTSKNTQGSGQELIIGSKKQIISKKTLYCHETFLPFATFFCHMQGTDQLYSVDLFEINNNNNNNNNNNFYLAVCHMDTSTWPADHVAFKSLKLSPGKGEVCHFYSQIDHAFIGA